MLGPGPSGEVMPPELSLPPVSDDSTTTLKSVKMNSKYTFWTFKFTGFLMPKKIVNVTFYSFFPNALLLTLF
jgi:hypothetical protein